MHVMFGYLYVGTKWKESERQEESGERGEEGEEAAGEEVQHEEEKGEY